MARGRSPFAHDSEVAHLFPDGWHRRSGHDVLAGTYWRDEELGLPLLLAARCDIHLVSAARRWLCRGSGTLARLAGARAGWRARSGADHVRGRRRTTRDGMG